MVIFDIQLGGFSAIISVFGHCVSNLFKAEIKKEINKSCKYTYNAVLHAKTQLKGGMRSPDNRHGDWRTVDDTQLNILLTFQILKYKYNNN